MFVINDTKKFMRLGILNGMTYEIKTKTAANIALALLGLDQYFFSNMAAVVRAGQASVGFWLLSCTFSPLLVAPLRRFC